MQWLTACGAPRGTIAALRRSAAVVGPRWQPEQRYYSDSVSKVKQLGLSSSSPLPRQKTRAQHILPHKSRSYSSDPRYAHEEAYERGDIYFSGIQPTGVPHIGNLLGALFNWAHLSKTRSDALHIFSIVGLHAMTSPASENLAESRQQMLALLLAVGIQPSKNVIVYRQEDVHQHAELFWILACYCGMGRLQRMTTWKGKLAALEEGSGSEINDSSSSSSSSSSSNSDSADKAAASSAAAAKGALNLGLFAYPVLQAADILLFNTTHVPVGEDQRQHLELCRELAQVVNGRNPTRNGRPLFRLPQTIVTPSPRVLSLRDPTTKMSKSSPDVASRILLTDDEATIRAKIKSAVTDSTRELSYDPEARPGVSNLLSICAALESWQDGTWGDETRNVTPGQVAERLNAASGGGSGTLKKLCADLLFSVLTPIRERYEVLIRDPAHLEALAVDGAAEATRHASSQLDSVRRTLGLVSLRNQ